MIDDSPPTKTPLAELLFRNNITLRDGGLMFCCSATALKNYADGTRQPQGETRELIARVLLGEVTIAQLRAEANLPSRPSPSFSDGDCSSADAGPSAEEAFSETGVA